MDLAIWKVLVSTSSLLLPPKQQMLHERSLERGPCSPSSACPGNKARNSSERLSGAECSFFICRYCCLFSLLGAEAWQGASPASHPASGGVSAHSLDTAEVMATGGAEAQGGCSLIHNESAATPQLPTAAASSSSLLEVICPRTLCPKDWALKRNSCIYLKF